MLYSPGFIKSLKAFLEVTVSGFNMSAGFFIAIMAFIIFAEICSLISMSFAAVVKAHTYNSRRVLKGLLWFAAYYFIAALCTVALVVIVFLIQGNVSELLAEMMSQKAIMAVLIVGALAYSLSAVIYYFVCNKMFKKGVNVD